MLAEVRCGIRQLVRRKTAGLTVILLIGMCIGSNTAIFAIVDALLIQKLPVRNADDLVVFTKTHGSTVKPDYLFSYQEFEQARNRTDLFTTTVAEQYLSESNMVSLGDDSRGRLVLTQIVSPTYFKDLGISAVVGRVLTEEDARSSDYPVVLSFRFWRSAFLQSPDILGKTIRLKGHVFVVVGVTEEAFGDIDVDRSPDVRLPISAAPLLVGYPVGDDGISGPPSFQIVSRLAPGVSAARAASAVLAPLRATTESQWSLWNLQQSKPMSNTSLREAIRKKINYGISLASGARGISALREDASDSLRLIMGSVALLFAVVCANVSVLLRAMFQERRKEFAVRLSLGATRWSIAQQVAAESLVFSLPGILLGLVFALIVSPVAVRFLHNVGSADFRSDVAPITLSVSIRLVLFVVGISVVCLATFAASYGLLIRNVELMSVMKGNSDIGAGDIAQTLLVSTQVALTIVLLTVGVLMIRTFWNLRHADLGFDPTNVLEVSLDSREASQGTTQFMPVALSLLEGIAHLPGVHSDAFAASAVMREAGLKDVIVPVGATIPPDTVVNTSVNFVTPGYFETMGIPFVAGTTFGENDFAKQPLPIVASHAFGDLFFPHQSVLNKDIVYGTDGRKAPDATIVGIVGSSKYRSPREPDPPTYYAPWSGDGSDTSLLLYIRSIGGPASVAASLPENIREINKSIFIVRVLSLKTQVDDSLWRERLIATLSAFFGLTALAVAAVGVYGLLAYSVQRRARELGLRIAFGARRRDVARTVCGRMLRYLVGGAVLGSLIALFAVKATRHLVFGVNPFDPLSFLLAIALLVIGAASIAGWVSWRAANISPAAVLRTE